MTRTRGNVVAELMKGTERFNLAADIGCPDLGKRAGKMLVVTDWGTIEIKYIHERVPCLIPSADPRRLNFRRGGLQFQAGFLFARYCASSFSNAFAMCVPDW
jgi:hypothetical protein